MSGYMLVSFALYSLPVSSHSCVECYVEDEDIITAGAYATVLLCSLSLSLSLTLSLFFGLTVHTG